MEPKPSGYWGMTTTLECRRDLNFQAILRPPFLNCVFCFLFFSKYFMFSWVLKITLLIYILVLAVLCFCCRVGSSLVVMCECVTAVTLLVQSTASRVWGFSSCVSWASEHRLIGSVVMAHGPSCSTACGVFLSQELKPWPLHWQAGSLPLGMPLSWTLILAETCSSRYSQQFAQNLNMINPE